MYDGFIQKRVTRRAGVEVVLHPYVTFLGTATPYLYGVLTDDFFVQGLGNRIMYILWDGKYSNITSDFYALEAEDESNEDVIPDDIINKLLELSKVRTPIIMCPDKLAEITNRYREAANKALEDRKYILSSYISRLHTLILKLVVIKSIARYVHQPQQVCCKEIQ